MPLDPQVKVLLDMMKGAPSFSELSPAAARKQMNDMRVLRNAEPPPSPTSKIARYLDPLHRYRYAFTPQRARVHSRCWSSITAADL